METPEQYTDMSYDTNIQHSGGCPDCERYERQIDRMNAKESELREENERLREENKLYREALTKALSSDMVPSIRLECESVLSKFQPKKDESNDELIKRG